MKTSWIEVDLARLDENIRSVRTALSPCTAAIFVVKADAYGHGLAAVARQAAQSGIDWFAVAYLAEAQQVRAVAPSARILILGAVEAGDVESLVRERLTPVVVSLEQGLELAAAAQAQGLCLPVHLKLDTGMGRFGLPWEEAVAAYEQLHTLQGLDIEGVCTHFASVEVKKPSLGAQQMARFTALCAELEKRAGRRLFRHASSSRAFLYQQDWDLDAVRPGIVLYGYGAGGRGLRLQTRPLLQWKTSVMQVKRVPAGFPVGYYSTHVTQAPTVLATIAAGYADGYHRALSNRGFVLIGGRRCAVVGRVSMNWITVDAGPDAAVRPGDEVVLMGEQGGAAIWADELAGLARTIPYEMLTSIRPGGGRLYSPPA